MHALRTADDCSFEHDALPWRDDVYRFALSLTRDEFDADDVVQDTYLRAFRSWHTFVPGTDCRRWLFTICRNAFLRSRERLSHQLELAEGERDAVQGRQAARAPAFDAPDDLFERLDIGSALDRALRRVPEPFRSAVILVDVEDQAYETAADALGIPVGTVRSRLFRGRRLMQELLAAQARDAGLGTAA